jgi:hypothetical protein
MEQNEYEKIVKAMADKGVPHWAFELLADLRHNEVMNSEAIDGIEFAVAVALKGFKDFENNDVHEGNYLQVIRKLTACYKKALDEIAEIRVEIAENAEILRCAKSVSVAYDPTDPDWYSEGGGIDDVLALIAAVRAQEEEEEPCK